MNSKELSDICKNDFLINKHFRGVYSIDNIPEPVPNSFFIINLSKQNEYGTHWTLLFMSRPDKKIIYFICSLNTNPKKYKLLYSIILKTGYRLWTVDRQLQSNRTTSCGAFVIFFAWLCSRSFSPPEIVKLFFTHHATSELYKNDLLCTTIISTIFNLRSASELLLDISFLKESKKNKKK